MERTWTEERERQDLSVRSMVRRIDGRLFRTEQSTLLASDPDCTFVIHRNTLDPEFDVEEWLPATFLFRSEGGSYFAQHQYTDEANRDNDIQPLSVDEAVNLFDVLPKRSLSFEDAFPDLIVGASRTMPEEAMMFGREAEEPELDGRFDFFVSYNQADRGWAEWIAWQLEATGKSTVLQAWDFQPGANFALKMNEATERSGRTIAILSPDYLRSKFTAPEWAAAFARDASGVRRRLIPVRVRPCELTGLLSQIIYIDLVALDEADAKRELLKGVADERGKPAHQPPFPGNKSQEPLEEPQFPGADLSPLPMTPPTSRALWIPKQLEIDEEEIERRALASIPPANHGYALGRLGLVLAAGPRRVMVRPAQLESVPLRERLTQRALFGETRIFDLETGNVSHVITDNVLLLGNDNSAITLDELGSLAVFLGINVPRPPGGIPLSLDSSVLIEEVILDRLQRALRFIRDTLDDIDPQRSLTAVAVAAAFLDVGHRVWRTNDEHRASPNAVVLPMTPLDRIIVELSPPVQSREILTNELDSIVQDLLVQLRRKSLSG